jgi:carbonic anhydrase
MEIFEARSPQRLDEVRQLFNEYWRALRFDPCFQGFASELAGLPGDYAWPAGRLGLAAIGSSAAGCIAMRPLDEGACEMKRLYVRDAFRGRGAGIALVRWVVGQAREVGYDTMYADTMPVMERALEMYERIGFERCGPYRSDPTEGAVYLRLGL